MMTATCGERAGVLRHHGRGRGATPARRPCKWWTRPASTARDLPALAEFSSQWPTIVVELQPDGCDDERQRRQLRGGSTRAPFDLFPWLRGAGAWWPVSQDRARRRPDEQDTMDHIDRAMTEMQGANTMTTDRRFRRFSIATIATLSLAGLACGSDDDGSATTDARPPRPGRSEVPAAPRPQRRRLRLTTRPPRLLLRPRLQLAEAPAETEARPSIEGDLVGPVLGRRSGLR